MERKWKALILVDGYNGGVAHITADQIRDHNIAMYGNGDWVLPVGDKFAYEIVNNNTINLSSGMVVMNGARAVTGYGKTEVLTIENGTSGYKRVDIIVAEYNKDNETLVESVTVKVVKGTLGSAYSDPALVAGDIRAGATKRQMALYRVKVNGLSIEAVEKMWTAAVATLGANIVPISKGGTGKTTAADALAALGGVSIKKVWSNASVSSTFAAQNIKLNLTDYDFVLIYWRIHKSGDATDGAAAQMTLLKMGTGTYMNAIYGIWSGTQYVGFCTRNAWVNTSLVGFADAYWHSGTNSGDKSNNYVIPVEIYGIKGVN